MNLSTTQGPAVGQRRATIERVTPAIDGGRFAIKRVPGEPVAVEADVFADGHDLLRAVVQYRPAGSPDWREAPMEPGANDRWLGQFAPDSLGEWRYQVVGWVDPFASWRRDLRKRVEAGQNVTVELLVGARWVSEAADRATGDGHSQLQEWARHLGDGAAPVPARLALALDDGLAAAMDRHPDRRFASVSEPELRVSVDPTLARYGAWYEMFPRSAAAEPGRHGTLADVERQLPRVAEMGFDVLYLPPIHPIGRTLRKGRNNQPACQPGDVGSPWAIGAAEGGHKAVHPDLGTLEDFRRLVRSARTVGIEVALDIAFQCSHDHPYVTEHPEWFRRRPDGTIQYAENPPKKYQDIYPFDFECAAWESLWLELRSVFEFWIEQGVTVYRVDNPHTKAFGFWEWCLGTLKERHPQLIFLSEAFTRPKLMYRLAKLGFTQSYNYFPWRNTSRELTEYLTDLTRSEVREYLRPNLWPNTPDILPQYLQAGGRPAFIIRLVLAATLGASYGLYGPAYELCVNAPREPGGEEYLDSEKYELKQWNLDAPDSLAGLIGRVNRIRRENPGLHGNDGLRFHPVDNEQLLAYTKTSADGANTVLVVVNLDPHHAHRGWLALPMDELGIETGASFQMHDLLTGARYLWSGPRNFVELDPKFAPAHIFRLRQRLRTERDFDYFL